MYQADAQHTGRSAFPGPRRLALMRTFATNQPQFLPEDSPNHAPDFQSSASVGADGTIYIGFHGGTLFALKDSPSARDRLDLAWSFHAEGASPWQSTPAIGTDGTVYMPFSTLGNDAKNTLYALRAPSTGTTAQVVWSVDLGSGQAGGPTGNSPVIGRDGTIYALSGGGQLAAVAANGTIAWTAQAGPAVKVSPALGPDGTVYTTSLDGKLYALSPPGAPGGQGTVKWTFDFGEHLGPTPLVSLPVAGPPTRGQDAVGSASSATIGPDGTIYVGANNSNFYAIDPNGQQKWLFEAERELAGIWTTAALSSDASTLYFGANKGGVYALNTRDGSRKWQFSIFASVYSSAILDARGTLYTGSSIGHVFAIDSSSGQSVADYDANASIWTAPAIRPDGTLVVANRNGNVLVLGESP
jgi:outer membrane protein assembly factor BamB